VGDQHIIGVQQCLLILEVHGLDLEIGLATCWLLHCSLPERRDDQRWHLDGLLDAQVDIILDCSTVVLELLDLRLDL